MDISSLGKNVVYGFNKGEESKSNKFGCFLEKLKENTISQVKSYKVDIDPCGNLVVSGDYKAVKAFEDNYISKDDDVKSNFNELCSKNNNIYQAQTAKKAIFAYKNSPTHNNYQSTKRILA